MYAFIFSKSRPRGFTLLEILIALAILAVVVSTLFGAFHGSVRHLKAGRSQSLIYDMARVCLERIAEDLSCALPPSEDRPAGGLFFRGEPLPHEEGAGHRLDFFSLAELGLAGEQPGGGARIRLETRQNEGQAEIRLYRSAHPLTADQLSAEDSGWLLCRYIRELRFSYHDQEGGEYLRWDSQAPFFSGRLPVLVKISLVLYDPSAPDNTYHFKAQVALPLARELEDEAPGN